VLARRGQFEEAEKLARDAVERTRPSDYIDDNAQVISSLAEVLALAGDAAGARTNFEQALDLYERKGNVVSAARTRERLQSLQAQ
jgi:Flp pilus assembly protein TadD